MFVHCSFMVTLLGLLFCSPFTECCEDLEEKSKIVMANNLQNCYRGFQAFSVIFRSVFQLLKVSYTTNEVELDV